MAKVDREAIFFYKSAPEGTDLQTGYGHFQIHLIKFLDLNYFISFSSVYFQNYYSDSKEIFLQYRAVRSHTANLAEL